MNLPRDISCETEVFEWLAASGWQCDEGNAATYDRVPALFPTDLVARLQMVRARSAVSCFSQISSHTSPDHAATPVWRGELLDVGWAVGVLWRPRIAPGPAP